MAWDIRLYEPSCKQDWDNFVADSRNGTFLFCRDYMEYHADRFQDYSLMCYHGGRLHAVLPAHVQGRTFCSHLGLTYGGMVTDEKVTAKGMLELFKAVSMFLCMHELATEWIYRPIPYIYSDYPSEEDLYALFRFGAQLSERKISTVIPADGRYKFDELRRRKVKKAKHTHFVILQDADYAAFWEVLETNLRERHGARPVHSLSEMELLHARFPSHILLYRVCTESGRTVAGCVLYMSRNVAHVQYIGSTEEGRANGVVDLLFHHLINDVYKDIKYFDMGTSVEDGGSVLNEGLIFQKEGFGGRAVVYDTYKMDLTKVPLFNKE